MADNQLTIGSQNIPGQAPMPVIGSNLITPVNGVIPTANPGDTLVNQLNANSKPAVSAANPAPVAGANQNVPAPPVQPKAPATPAAPAVKPTTPAANPTGAGTIPGWNTVNPNPVPPATPAPATPPAQPTPPTTPPLDKATQDTVNRQTLMALIKTGAATPEELAAGSGLSLQDVNLLIDSDPNNQLAPTMAVQLKDNQATNQIHDTIASLTQKMTDISNGIFTLSPAEQAQIDSIKSTYTDLENQQLQANKNYEGSILTGEIRSGRQEFMNQISTGTYAQAVNEGISKIKALENDALNKVSTLTTAFKNDDYKTIAGTVTALQKNLDDKTKAIADMNKATMDLHKQQVDDAKAAAALTSTNIKNFTDAIPAIPANLSEGDYQFYAKAYGVPENTVKGMIQAYNDKQQVTTVKQDQTMIAKGYNTVSPNDINDLKAKGYDVQTLNGRAYAKAGKLTSKTYKGVTSWYDDKGNLVKTDKAAGGGTKAPTTPSFTPTEKKKLEQAGLSGSTRQQQLDFLYGKSEKVKTEAQTKQENVDKVNSYFNGIRADTGYPVLGKDLKVSPDDWALAKKSFMEDGGTANEFETKFSKYKNPDNKNYN